MRGHLPAMRVWIGSSANRGLQLFERRHAELETERAIAVVGIKPIIARLQSHAGRNQNCFVSGAADLKENLVLVLELDLLVVKPARKIHRAIHLHHFFTGETRGLASLGGGSVLSASPPSLRIA